MAPAQLPAAFLRRSWARAGWCALALGVAVACVPQDNYLGYDRISVVDEPDGGFSGPPLGVGDDDDDDDEPDSGGAVLPPVPPREEDAGDGEGEEEPAEDAGVSPASSVDASTTEDEPSLPEPDGGLLDVTPLMPNLDLPNHFDEALGVDDETVLSRLDGMFQQLFYGEEQKVIYYEVDEDKAYIYDALHEDTRIDALGYGMMIAVQLNHQAEFDKIWNFTRTYFQYEEGPHEGFFRWRCDTSGEECEFGPSTFGAIYVTTALLFAEGRWGNGDGIYDYGAEARYQLDVMQNKEELAGGIVDGVTNAFNPDTYLPNALPEEGNVGLASPGAVIPAFFEVWGLATENPFWTQAAARSRSVLIKVAHPSTGLPPQRFTHEGEIPEGEDLFNEGAYAYGMNLALDQAWYGVDPAQVEVADRIIGFFATFPSQPYPAIYESGGQSLNQNPSGALVAINGATAGIATRGERDGFIRTVWYTPLADGIIRFFDGVNQLFAIMYLGGQFRAYGVGIAPPDEPSPEEPEAEPEPESEP